MIPRDHGYISPNIYFPANGCFHNAAQLFNMAALARRTSDDVMAGPFTGISSTPAIPRLEASFCNPHTNPVRHGFQYAVRPGAGYLNDVQLEVWRCSGQYPSRSRSVPGFVGFLFEAVCAEIRYSADYLNHRATHPACLLAGARLCAMHHVTGIRLAR